MKFRFLLILFSLFFFVSSLFADGTSWWNTDYNSTEGTEFYVTFMPNIGKKVPDKDLVLMLYATARQDAHIIVTGKKTIYGEPDNYEDFKAEKIIKAGKIDSILIPNEVAYLEVGNQTNNNEWLNKGIKITSDKPIALYTYNSNTTSYDASLIIPIEGTYKEYVIQTYSKDNQSTEFAIVSAEDDNEITINLRENQEDKENIQFTLNKSQSYCYRTEKGNTTLEGTTICATKPISVFQGGQYAGIPNANKAPQSHIYHQAFSTDYWGKHYVITRTAKQKFDYVRFTAAEDNTIIKNGNTTLATLNKLDTWEYIIEWSNDEKAREITSNKAVGCYLYSSVNGDQYGSPSLTPIVPSEQGIKSIILATFHETFASELNLVPNNPSPDTLKHAKDTLDKYYHHYANIVTKKEHVKDMRMDNVSISNQFSNIANSNYSCAVVKISNGTHILTSSEDFTCRVYGMLQYNGDNDDFDINISYAYSGGNNCLHSAHMLIDGQRINRKIICFNEKINFSSVINYDTGGNEPIKWLFVHNSDTVNDIVRNGASVNNMKFPNPGLWNVNLIVNRITPICNYTISDTIQAQIDVAEEFDYAPSKQKGTLRDICEDDVDGTLVKGETYQYKTDTMKVGKTYDYTDTLKSSLDCDSIVHIKVTVRPKYEKTLSMSICQNQLPYKWNGHTISESEISSYPYTTTKTASLKSQYGCDSIVHMKFTVYKVDRDTIVENICDKDRPYHWDVHGKDSLIYSDGTFSDTLKIGLCDDIRTLILKINGSSVVTLKDTICEGETFTWNESHYEEHNPLWTDTIIKTTGHYERRYKTKDGCDDIRTVDIFVAPKGNSSETKNICQNELPFIWSPTDHTGTDYTQTISKEDITTYPYSTTLSQTLKTIYGCDSIVTINLTVNSVGRDTTYIAICNADAPYKWLVHNKIHNLTETGLYSDTISNSKCFDVSFLDLIVYPDNDIRIEDAGCEPITIDFGGTKTFYAGIIGDTIYKDTIHVVTPQHCEYDSILYLQVFKSYHYNETTTISDKDEFVWHDGNHGVLPVGQHTFELSKKTLQGCDSIYTCTVTVQQSFANTTNIDLCFGEEYQWNGHLKDTIIRDLPVGEHTIIDANKTIEGQDSTYTLVVNVHERYERTIDKIEVCQDKVPYRWQLSDSKKGTFDKIIYIPSNLAFPFDTICTDTLHTLFGCDSIVHLPLRILPTYVEDINVTVCESEMPFTWSLTDNTGKHEKVIELPQQQTGIGWKYSDVYALQTSNAVGCDSIIRLNLTVIPTVTYEHYLTICQEQTPFSDFGNHDLSVNTSGTYTVNINQKSIQYGCDSIEILHLTVIDKIITPLHIDICNKNLPYIHPTEVNKLKPIYSSGLYYDTLKNVMGCDSILELTVSVHQEYEKTLNIDICDNEYFDFNDSIFSGKPGFYHYDTLLYSIYGCDSLVHLNLTIHPTYLFVTDTAVCFGADGYKWRGKTYNETGIYYDSLTTTTYGCDSVYMLRLYVKPAYRYNIFNTICDNETLYHLAETKMVVWEPGMAIPNNELGDYIELYATTPEGCDSTYLYHLTINPTYDITDKSDSICSNETYHWHGGTYQLSLGWNHLDTIFTTINGCDSAFHVDVFVKQSYYFIDYMTICNNETYLWREQEFSNLTEGNYTFFDKYTTIYGCDSIYELRLKVLPSYFSLIEESICIDESYYFHGRELREAGFYYDSLLTINGCDSVFHLYLTVNDTTSEYITDSICYGESITIYGNTYDKSGHYTDTILNKWGCKHYVSIDLDVIEYTIPKIWADSICADNDAYELFLSYSGEKPIEFSLYYNDFGHSQGFEDIVHGTIDNVDTLLIPMPLRNNDRTQYPRPDHYPIELYVFNPYCQDSIKQHTSADIILSYPSWVTEQRFRDVIAILSTAYNGGYTFDTYQWYKNGEALIGETHEYLYLPQELIVDTAEYYVRLTRPGELESYQTCPITIFYDAIDTIAPALDYLSVVPTYVVSGHPVVNILSHGKNGTYKIYSIEGLYIQGGNFIAGEKNAFEVKLPGREGCYIFILHSDDSKYEPDRHIIVIVGP